MFTAERVGDPKDYIKGETGDWEIWTPACAGVDGVKI